jgi:hypothetical protein
MKDKKSRLRNKSRMEVPSYISMEEFIKKYDASARSTPRLGNHQPNAPINAIDMLFIAFLTVTLITLVLILA